MCDDKRVDARCLDSSGLETCDVYLMVPCWTNTSLIVVCHVFTIGYRVGVDISFADRRKRRRNG